MNVKNTSMAAVKVKPDAGDIFSYKMYHSFCSLQGVFRIILSVIFLVVGFLTFGHVDLILSFAVLAFGILNPIVSPIMFMIQARQSASALKPVTYTFSQEKITANDGKKRVDLNWDQLALIVWRKKAMYIYTAPTQALILPRRAMDGKDDAILAIIQGSANPNRTVYRKF